MLEELALSLIMAKAYTKEDIVEAALMRFTLGSINISKLRPMYDKFYDTVGKDEFRKYASVTPEVMKNYFESKK